MWWNEYLNKKHSKNTKGPTVHVGPFILRPFIGYQYFTLTYFIQRRKLFIHQFTMHAHHNFIENGHHLTYICSKQHVMDQINCKISKVIKRADDVLFIDIDKNKTFEKRDFIELTMAARKIVLGKKFYSIINVGEYTLPNKEAREATSSITSCELKIANALVVKTMAQRIMANMMIKINLPEVPTQIFSNLREAENWIKNLKTQNITY